MTLAFNPRTKKCLVHFLQTMKVTKRLSCKRSGHIFHDASDDNCFKLL